VTAAETAPDADEIDHLDALLARQHAILTGVANALRGDPGPLASHSHHDLAERAAAVVAEIATLRSVRMEPMSLEALDAACAAEDRATVDDPLLDGTDGAHPAWWRGHDRAAQVWRERVATAERERDEARAAAAGVLAGGGAAGDATVRRDLPSVAVVVCPACGVDITADLDDGGAYVTRRHSRREPARVGLGDVVWCDGGLVRGAS